MGILSRMQGKSDGKIQVAITPDATGPGGEMVIKFSILEELDGKARTVLAGIECTGHYKVQERYKDSNDRYQTRQVWRETEIYKHQQPMMLQHGEQEARFVLPDDAQPGSFECVEWAAYARVDREKGIDVVENVPFNVRVPLDRIPNTRTQNATANGMTITNVPTAAAEGDVLEGKLIVNLTESVKARAVSIRLFRRQTYVAEAINDYSLYSGDLFFNNAFWSNTSRIIDEKQVAETDIAEKVEFEPGVQQEFAWALQVPDAGPTSSHRYAQVDWRIEAVLDRRLRGDVGMTSPIIIV